MIARKINAKKIKIDLPENSFDRAEKKDVTLVNEIFTDLNSQYTPGEAIKGLRIVL